MRPPMPVVQPSPGPDEAVPPGRTPLLRPPMPVPEPVNGYYMEETFELGSTGCYRRPVHTSYWPLGVCAAGTQRDYDASTGALTMYDATDNFITLLAVSDVKADSFRARSEIRTSGCGGLPDQVTTELLPLGCSVQYYDPPRDEGSATGVASVPLYILRSFVILAPEAAPPTPPRPILAPTRSPSPERSPPPSTDPEPSPEPSTDVPMIFLPRPPSPSRSPRPVAIKVVTQEVVIAGTVSSFGEAEQETYKAGLAAEIGVEVSQITLRVLAASVRVVASIALGPDESEAAVVTSLRTMSEDKSGMSAKLGVSVESAGSISVWVSPSSPSPPPAARSPPARSPAACCAEARAECWACQQGMTVDELCSSFGSVTGCPSPTKSPPPLPRQLPPSPPARSPPARSPPVPSPPVPSPPARSPPSTPTPPTVARSTLTRDMVAGWNFVSLNVVASDMSISSLLSDVAGAGDYVKNQATFSEYYAGYGFFGGLSAFATTEMYAVKLAASATLIVTGTPVILPMVVTLSAGWTFLPCPYQTSVSISDGGPVFEYSAGAEFKSQTSFTEYYDGFGWFGTLTTLEPGLGYKIRVAAGGPATFQAI